MREIVVSTFISLDGVMQAPGGPEEDLAGGFALGGWAVPHFDEALGNFIDAVFSPPFELLLGRTTYDIFAAHWPYMSDDPMGRLLNKVKKHVATSSPQTLTWNNSHALEGDAAAAVARLKREDGPRLLIQGSSQLLQTLLAHDLVDRISLIVEPVILGGGKRLFGEGSRPAGLKLVHQEASSTGVVMATWLRDGEPKTGSFAMETPSAEELARRAKAH